MLVTSKVSRDDPSLQTIAVIAPRGAIGRGGWKGGRWKPLDLLGWNQVIFSWIWLDLDDLDLENPTVS